jgi:hypothetical protein
MDNKKIEGEVSERFKEAFDDCGGSSHLTCECGRTHYDTSHPGDYEAGELERFDKMHEQDPEKYIPCDHSIGYYCIDGKSFVWDCPCKGGLPYEKFIKKHRHGIAEYLNSLADAMDKDSKLTRVKEQK